MKDISTSQLKVIGRGCEPVVVLVRVWIVRELEDASYMILDVGYKFCQLTMVLILVAWWTISHLCFQMYHGI